MRQKLQQIRIALNAACAEIAKQHDLRSLAVGKCIFDPHAGNFTFKIEGVDGKGIDRDAARYNESLSWLKLPPLGTEFTLPHTGKTYKIAGLNTTGTKVKCSCGSKLFLFSVDAVERLTEKAKPSLRRRTS